MTTITTTAPTITAAGISAPAYADVLAFLQAQYQLIYGADVYLGPDSQDGQFLAIIAAAINDANAIAILIYNSFAPSTASGAALSNQVAINGLQRLVPTNSTVDLLITGQAGATISNGAVTDTNGNTWNLPTSVVIPVGGSITVTATCAVQGAVAAAASTITQIATPTLGWQTVTNPAAAAPGAPVETDAALRLRQSVSVALPAQSVLEGMVGAILAVPGVLACVAYENDTTTTNTNGIPPYSVAFVVEGGDVNAIAAAIFNTKTVGTGTYGTTSVQVTDTYGLQHTINFFVPTTITVTAALNITPFNGYTAAIGAAVQAAVAAYISAVPIGGGDPAGVDWDGAFVAAKSVTGGNTFKIESLTLTGPGGAGAPDVPLAFNQLATCTAAQVTLTVA